MTYAPRLVVPGLLADEQETLDVCLEQLRAKRGRNRLRSDLYDGKHAIRDVGAIIPPTFYQTAIVLGWPAKAVDLPARRCNLDGFAWTDGDLTSLGYDELDAANSLRSETSQAITSMLLHSVAFAIASPGGDNEPGGMIHYRDALSCTGVYDPRRRRLSSALSVSEWESNPADGATSVIPAAFTVYLDGRVTTARKVGAGWSIERAAHGFGVPVEPLVYRPRLGRPFGMSRISRPVISAYREAVKTCIRMTGTADLHSFPQLVLLGASSDIFRNPDGTMRSAWEVALGRVFALPDDDEAENPRASVQRFDGVSPEPHLKMLRQQAELFSGETSIPLASLGISGDGNPTSAESYLASREDLISEAEGITDDISAPLTRTIARALAMQGGETSVPDSWAGLTPRWRSPVHLSRAAEADAGAKVLGAIPWLADTSVGLELVGLTEDQRRRASAERRKAEARKLGTSLAAASGIPTDAPVTAPSGPAAAPTGLQTPAPTAGQTGAPGDVSA